MNNKKIQYYRLYPSGAKDYIDTFVESSKQIDTKQKSSFCTFSQNQI